MKAHFLGGQGQELRRKWAHSAFVRNLGDFYLYGDLFGWSACVGRLFKSQPSHSQPGSLSVTISSSS